jgi:acetyl-CoA carboxylase biotin carboxyl carrier protein
MAILGFEFEEISRLIALVEAGNLDEIIYEEEDRYLRIRGPRPQVSNRTQEDTSPTVTPYLQRMESLAPPRREVRQRALGAASPSDVLPEDEIALVSPMVGVFYRAGKPGDPPLVEVGQRIVREQTIGVIEAMKIFSEIPAEHGGVVVAVPAKDGQLVQAGTPLVILKRE